MNFSAVEHVCTDNFCYPLDENHLVINIKTGMDVHRVFLVYGDPFDGILSDGKWKWIGQKVQITKKKELQHHLWWTIRVEPKLKRCKYYFELQKAGSKETWCYLEDGFYRAKYFARLRAYTSYFVFPWMNKADIISSPAWVKNTVWYQIFPERFCRGDPPVSAAAVLPWPESDSRVKNEERYGGDLRGIIDKLDYLASLNIGGLYLNPINMSESVHKYDTSDYLTIDPLFGDVQLMTELCCKAHSKGIRIMLDGVFNHCGWQFAPWQDVVKNGAQSKYWDWFMVKEWPFDIGAADEHSRFNQSRPSGTNAQNAKYMAFAYVDCMPKLNTNNKEVIDYLLNICEGWVRRYDIDAIRLDVANELSHVFCRQLRERMLRIKNDFYIIGEIWHNAMPWLRGFEFDAVMNYPLAHSIYDFWLKTDRKVKRLEHNINRCAAMYPQQVNSVLFNLLDSHDTARLITKNCGNQYKTWQQYAFLFALAGSVCIYYGTEILLEGAEDPDCRRCMPWKKIEAGDYAEQINIIKQLIDLRRTKPAMRCDDYEFVYDLDPDDSKRIIHLKKESSDETEKSTAHSLHLILNCGKSPLSLKEAIYAGKKKTELFFSILFEKDLLMPGGFVFFEK